MDDYVIKFDNKNWLCTTPVGNVEKFPTLQAAVESAKWRAVHERVDVYWYDRQGNLQGHSTFRNKFRGRRR